MGVKAIFQKFEASSLNRYGVLFGTIFRDCRGDTLYQLGKSRKNQIFAIGVNFFIQPLKKF